MRGVALLFILVIVLSLALREVVERNFETEIKMVQEEAKRVEASVAGSTPARQGPSAATTSFRGPTGKPYIIGPTAPPPGD